MKITLIPSAYAPAVGGVEELTYRLATRLQADRDRVQVWTHRHPGTLPVADTIAGVEVRRFAMPLPAAAVGDVARFSVAGGRALGSLARALRSFRPDVLHVQCFSSNGVYATAISRLTGIPLVVSLQGETVMDDNDIYEHSATLRAGLRWGLRHARAVTGCSQFVIDDAVERFGLPVSKGQVVYNGVEIDDTRPPEPFAIPQDRFVFAVGRVVEKKGFDLLLEAFAAIAPARPDVGLVIGGDGRARGALVERARALHLSDRVAFPGVLSREQVAWAMRNATVFVLPSRVEPFGIVVVEALHGGRPTVVSARGGAGEIVRHEREGLVVDPFNTPALADAIARLLDDEGLSRRLGAAARERARDFAWERIAGQYREIYRSVIT